MMDFVLAALPFVCVGIAVALLAVKHSAVVTVKNDDGTETRKRGTESTYMTEGMCIGMCLAMLFGTEYTAYGMLLGLRIGMFIKK